MTNNNIDSDLRKILFNYIESGEKKLLKKSIKDINVKKKVFLFYSKRRNIPICALPKLHLVLGSRSGFISFCYNFFSFTNSSKTIVEVNKKNIEAIAKFVVSHEVGHILDPNISNSKTEYSSILTKIINLLLEHNIDINSSNFYKSNLPVPLEDAVVNLKKNLIDRETKAWDIAEDFLVFEDNHEKFIFNKIKEYALATYNFGNLKTIVREHNIDLFFKYKRHLA